MTDSIVHPGLARGTEPARDEHLLAEIEALRRLSTLQERLFERAIGNADVKSVVDTLSHLMGKVVVAIGPGFGPGPPATPSCVPRCPASLGQTDAAAIVVDHVVVGHLVLAGESESSDLADCLVLEGAARIIAMLLQRVRSNVGAAQRARQQIITDLLGGRLDADVEWLARGLGLGCDLSHPKCLFVVEFGATPMTGGLGEAPFLAAVNEVLAGLPFVSGFWRGRGVALIFGDAPTSRKSSSTDEVGLEDITEQVRAELESRASNGPPLVAVVSGFAPAFDGPRHMNEAIEVLRVARRLGRVKSVIRTDDRDLRAYQILAEGDDAGRGKQFVQDVIGRLETYDATRVGRLLETLEAYLDHNGNLKSTACALFIHVSTLKYRLSRIAKISGLSLHDPGDRFHAQLALRLRRLWQSDPVVHSS